MPQLKAEWTQQRMVHQRWRLLHQVDDWIELPLAVLGIVWLALLVIELVRGVNPLLDRAAQIIWGVFVAEFLLRMWIAPRKLAYLRRNWLILLSLLLPAVRGVRALRAASSLRALRLARGTRLLRILTSFNRGMRALRRSLGRRGIAYVAALSAIVATGGAAGMYALEGTSEGFGSFSESLWWTAMLMTTIASESWPHTPEGRLLALLISIYSIAVFGYITAVLASFFVEQSDEIPASKALLAEIRELRREIEKRSADPAADSS